MLGVKDPAALSTAAKQSIVSMLFDQDQIFVEGVCSKCGERIGPAWGTFQQVEQDAGESYAHKVASHRCNGPDIQ